MERGKPREWETQILVGELELGNKNNAWDRKVDKYLSPVREQNMAYKILFFLYIRIEVLWKKLEKS